MRPLKADGIAFVGAHPVGDWHALSVRKKPPTGVGSYKHPLRQALAVLTKGLGGYFFFRVTGDACVQRSNTSNTDAVSSSACPMAMAAL